MHLSPTGEILTSVFSMLSKERLVQSSMHLLLKTWLMIKDLHVCIDHIRLQVQICAFAQTPYAAKVQLLQMARGVQTAPLNADSYYL
jgi:hypothetical protein